MDSQGLASSKGLPDLSTGANDDPARNSSGTNTISSCWRPFCLIFFSYKGFKCAFSLNCNVIV